MIRLTPKAPDLIKMEIKMHLPQEDVIRFLQNRGYEVIAYKQVFPATEEFLVSEPRLELWTFTATKQGEQQSNQTEYLKVFEKELKAFLNELQNA